MSDPGIIAVTGLGTFLGQRLQRRLLERRSRRPLVAIDSRRPYGLPRSVHFHSVDLTDPTADGALAEVFEKEGVGAVLHTAFRTEPTAAVDYDHELETIGTLHLLNACAAGGVRRLVVASTTRVYGPHPDNPNFLTEDHPIRGHADAHNIRNRVEAERLVADFARRYPEVEVTVLRPCLIMGPTYHDSYVRHFDRKTVPIVLGYDPLIQFLHEDDCLHAFEVALLEGRPGVFNLVGRGVVPLTTLLRSAGKRPLPIPAPLLYRLGRVPSEAQTGDPPGAFFDYLRWLFVADGAKGWDAFGEPHYSTREAWMSFISSRRMRAYR